MENGKCVIVTNVSPSATEKTVSDFFSFCGKIVSMKLTNEEGRATKSAVVQFETESAAKTALLLSNALIVDLPIAVVPYSEEAASSSTTAAGGVESSSSTSADDIRTREFNVPDEHRSKTSVIVSLIAAGYVLGEESIQKAKEFDEKHNILLQARIGYEQGKKVLLGVDQKLHLSEKVLAVTAAVEEKAKQVDEKYQLSDKAQLAATMVRDKTTETIAKLKENNTVAGGINKFNDLADNVKAQVTSKYNDIQQQVSAAVAEKRAHGEAQPVSTVETIPEEVEAMPSQP